VMIMAAVEGLVDEAVVRRPAEHAGLEINQVHGKNGKDYLRRRIGAYNNAARISPWLVLVDLNREADCPPPLCRIWVPAPAPHMCFRVAVRSVESWLLADREQIARFLGIRVTQVVQNPEAVPNPRDAVVSLAAKSRRNDIRKDMVPRPGSGRPVGPAYASRLIEFVGSHWQPDVAARFSDSLRRCLIRLKELGRDQP